jgi:hypothetical protein
MDLNHVNRVQSKVCVGLWELPQILPNPPTDLLFNWPVQNWNCWWKCMFGTFSTNQIFVRLSVRYPPDTSRFEANQKHKIITNLDLAENSCRHTLCHRNTKVLIFFMWEYRFGDSGFKKSRFKRQLCVYKKIFYSKLSINAKILLHGQPMEQHAMCPNLT